MITHTPLCPNHSCECTSTGDTRYWKCVISGAIFEMDVDTEDNEVQHDKYGNPTIAYLQDEAGWGRDGRMTIVLGKLVVAWDTDDTLIVPAIASGFDTDVPNYETIAVYQWFQRQGAHMIIWSGGGADYAKHWAEKFGLVADEYLTKDPALADKVDIAFDDSDVKLGKVNVKVKRLKNHIVRYPEKI